ncbi:MAG: sugar transporter [Rikenellaceae bacterium]
MAESRTKKSLLNAQVSTVYYFLALFMSFFTRKIYLDCMGAEFMGLPSTLGSFMSFLSLAELGVGSAIAFTLYKPLAHKSYEEVKKIISIQGYIYSKVGYIILTLGIIVSLFFPLIFKDTTLPFGVIYFAFYCYLTNAMVGYFINYNSVVFDADQREYEITRYTQSMTIIRFLVAAAVAKWSGNFYLFVSLDLIFGVISCIIVQWRVQKLYPWLKTSIKSGREYLKEYPIILTKTKQIFAHKIGTLAQYQITPLVIYSVTSLSSVTLYANYTVITEKLAVAINLMLGGTGASVGNLIAEGDRDRIMKVYYEMFSLKFAIAGYFTFMLSLLVEPFITMWLGAEYLLDHSVLVVLLVASFIFYLRGFTEQFIAGYGLFHDIWAPYTEAAICMVATIVCGHFFGLTGVIMGNTISTGISVLVWKPYFLFSRGFECSVWEYWLAFFVKTAVWGVASFVAYYIYRYYPLVEITNFTNFVIVGVYLTLMFSVVYIPLLMTLDEGFRCAMTRVTGIFRNRFK